MLLQYCFWIEGSFTFLVYVWGVYYFWCHPQEPVWGGLAERRFFLPWLVCELAGAVPCALITAELWESTEWHTILWYSFFLLGEAAWMILTVYKQIQWNRLCLYTITLSAALLTIEVYIKNPVVGVTSFLLTLHIGLWDALFWMDTWEAEVKAQENTEYV